MKFFDTNKIKYADLLNSVKSFLIRTYNQAESVFSTASPFGQIINVLNTYVQLIFLYLEDATTEQNILTANKEKSIYGWSRLTGHNPTRAISAQGTIQIKLKQTVSDVTNSSFILLLDETKLTCVNNSLPYFIKFGNATGNMKVSVANKNFISIKLIQGEIQTQIVTGNGEALQSYSILAKKPIDNDNVQIFVNGEPFEIVDSLYDMTLGSKTCMVKTGISGGIDVYFGNDDFGTIPSLGAKITIKYVLTDGFAGNIYSKSNSITFKWQDTGYASNGDELDLNEIFDVFVEKAIVLGADSESSDLTKLIAPKSSRSFVLANPDNYIHLLSRFGYSYVNAYTTFDDDYIADDNIVNLLLLPDVSKRIYTNIDYYTTPLPNFYLSDDEKTAIYSFINKSGQQIITTELNIIDPTIKRYTCNVFLRIYDTADVTSLKNEIIDRITEYLLTVKRRDKIPKSDFISILENVQGVDSVNIAFISEENELAITNGYYIQTTTTTDKIRGLKVVTQNKVNLASGVDPNLGLDEFGDIKIGLNELPVIRGGWYDRFNNYYEDGIDFDNFSSVNIVIKEVINENLAVRITNANKNLLLK